MQGAPPDTEGGGAVQSVAHSTRLRFGGGRGAAAGAARYSRGAQLAMRRPTLAWNATTQVSAAACWSTIRPAACSGVGGVPRYESSFSLNSANVLMAALRSAMSSWCIMHGTVLRGWKEYLRLTLEPVAGPLTLVLAQG